MIEQCSADLITMDGRTVGQCQQSAMFIAYSVCEAEPFQQMENYTCLEHSELVTVGRDQGLCSNGHPVKLIQVLPI